MSNPETVTTEEALAITIQLFKELKEEKEVLEKRVAKYEGMIEDIYDACTCERHETDGFDYHECHPKLGLPGAGARWLTPRDLIETRIGYDWEYEKPEGPCKSWKVLRLLKNKKPTGAINESVHTAQQ